MKPYSTLSDIEKRLRSYHIVIAEDHPLDELLAFLSLDDVPTDDCERVGSAALQLFLHEPALAARFRFNKCFSVEVTPTERSYAVVVHYAPGAAMKSPRYLVQVVSANLAASK